MVSHFTLGHSCFLRQLFRYNPNPKPYNLHLAYRCCLFLGLLKILPCFSNTSGLWGASISYAVFFASFLHIFGWFPVVSRHSKFLVFNKMLTKLFAFLDFREFFLILMCINSQDIWWPNLSKVCPLKWMVRCKENMR